MITISDLSVFYEGEEALHGVSAVFPKGKISVILGPNGSGKSTLLKSLIRLNTGNGGRIVLDGQPLESLSQRALSRRVAYLPQTRNIPDITVERLVMHGRFPYLSYPRRYRREDHEIVREALERMQMTPYAQRRMGSLSGGQRQKAYLAMALAQDTDVILMDEPTTFLDARSQLEMLERIRSLSEAGKTILMILHDFELALRYADYCLLLGEGRALVRGSAEEVLRSQELRRVFGVTPCFFEAPDGLHCYARLAEERERI